MLWVRNLSVMELGALFSKTGICCLKHCFANVCVVLCMCKSVLQSVKSGHVTRWTNLLIRPDAILYARSNLFFIQF